MKQYEIIWKPVDMDSHPQSTRIETNCWTLDAIENAFVLTEDDLWELWCQSAMSQVDHETKANNESAFKTYLQSKGIQI